MHRPAFTARVGTAVVEAQSRGREDSGTVLWRLSPAATSEPLGPSRTSSLLPLFPLQPLVFAVSTGQLATPWEEQRDASRLGVGRNALGTDVLVEQVAVMVQPRLCVMVARWVPALLPCPPPLAQQSQAQALWHDCRLMVSSPHADSCRRKTPISRSTWRKRPKRRRG